MLDGRGEGKRKSFEVSTGVVDGIAAEILFVASPHNYSKSEKSKLR